MEAVLAVAQDWQSFEGQDSEASRERSPQNVW